MKRSNTVYRYAIRKLKVGTASIAVAALMFLGSGNAVATAADLNQNSAFVANADPSQVTQVEASQPSQESPNSDLDLDTQAVDSVKTPVTNVAPIESVPEVESQPVLDAEAVAQELADLEVDEESTEVSAEVPADMVSEAVSEDERAEAESVNEASLAEAESTVAAQVAAANEATVEAPAGNEEVKPLAYANSAADNKIVLPAGFTPDLFKEGAYTAAQVDAIAKPGRALNTYKSNEADKNEVVDVTNLTEAQRTELSLFVAGLINPIREQFGKQPYKVNAGSVNAANKVADAYQADNWYAWTSSHDVNGTTRALANIANGWGENLATISPNTTTMDDLKQQFHYQTVWMLFDDSHADFGHARNFLLFENPYGNHDVYLGVSTNRAGASSASQFGTQYYTMFAPKDGATEFTPGNDYTVPGSDNTTPTQPTQPEQPTQPTQPEQPTNPTQPEQPTQPTQPEQPTQPTQPEQPTQPTQPEQPTQPTQPEQPTNPTQPEQPTQPTQPEQPTQPTQPEQPSQPEQPTNPSDNNGTGQNGNQNANQNTGNGDASQQDPNRQPARQLTAAQPQAAGQSAEGKQLPDTGESHNLLILAAAALSALSGIALLALRRKKA